MKALLVTVFLMLLAPAATALELPFTLGPITCRADVGVEAEIPRCDIDFKGAHKKGSCVVRTGSGPKQKRHLVHAEATPIARHEIGRGPDPLVFSHQGVTCWLMIPAYVDGYRCQRIPNGLDCTACLRGECYRGQMNIREVEETRGQ